VDEERLRGTISAVGVAGERIVVGAWSSSPVGPFADVMRVGPGGVRTLLAPDQDTADYVAGIYVFDRVEVAPIEWSATPSMLDLRAVLPDGRHLELDLAARGGGRVPCGGRGGSPGGSRGRRPGG
jgi:hypothetical protein